MHENAVATAHRPVAGRKSTMSIRMKSVALSMSLSLLSLSGCSDEAEAPRDAQEEGEDANADREQDEDENEQADAGADARADAGGSRDGGVPDGARADAGTPSRGDAGAPGASRFHVALSKAEEVPLCANAGAKARGAGALEISADGTKVAAVLEYEGLSGTPAMAHIHFGDKGVAGPVVLNFGMPLTTLQKTFTAADYKPPAGAPADFAALVEAIRAGKTYFNIHTAACMPGEIRGQIDPADAR